MALIMDKGYSPLTKTPTYQTMFLLSSYCWLVYVAVCLTFAITCSSNLNASIDDSICKTASLAKDQMDPAILKSHILTQAL